METYAHLRNILRSSSTESHESGEGRRQSVGESMASELPRPRRLSISEMILGSPGKGGFSWGQGLLERKLSMDKGDEKKESITNEERFKELMKRETNVLNDDPTFSRKNYTKKDS